MMAKLVTALISPLGTSLALGLCALCLLRWAPGPTGRRWTARTAVFALAWLWLWSTPLASDALRGAIENQAGPRAIDAVEPAPVLVVLGGGVYGARAPMRPHPDLRAAADRVWHAARLFHAGKAPRVLLSGGTMRTGSGSEAQAMQRLLLDLGVPDGAIELEDGSGNTAGNAALSARLLKPQGVDRVILVTSALHMPRARQSFERAGFQVIPAPTDFEVIDMPFDAMRLLPDADALDGSARAFKELLGKFTGH